jgi:hypothetical protein
MGAEASHKRRGELMARYLLTPSGDVVVAMSVVEAMGLLDAANGIATPVATPGSIRAQQRAKDNLAQAVARAKEAVRSRPLRSQMAAVERLDANPEQQ